MSTTFQPVMLPFPPITELQGTVELEQGGTGSEITAPLADALFFYNSTTQASQLLPLANHIVISGTFGVRNYVGATAMTAGQNGLVPAPLAGEQGKFLRADGTWANVGGGGDLLASNNLSDLSDLQEAKDNLNIEISDVANLQTSLNAKANTSHSHAISDVTNLQTSLNGKAATSHSHAISDVTNLQTTLDAKANTTHSHAISDVTNLQTSLDAKANTTHSHAISDVTNLQTSLDAKANTTHSHAISDVTNLQTSLDAKANTTHSHAISDVTNLQTSLDAKLNVANPSSTGIFTHTGGANEDATFNVNNNGRFRVTIDDAGRTAGWQNTVLTTRFDEESTNQVGVQADFTHTTGNASSTNFFTPLASSFGGSHKANFLVSYNPFGTWTNSTDVKGKLRFHVSDNVGISFGSDTSSGNRRFFFGSWSQEFGIIVPNGTNYDITIPSTQGAAGTVLTNDGSGGCSWSAAGVTGFTGSQHTSSPNATVNVSRLLVTASSTNADFAITPKGTGAIIAHVPDGTATGGNKRGANAIDLQTVRSSASQVASGQNAILLGNNSTASGSAAIALGSGSTASNTNAFAVSGGNASGNSSMALLGGTASGTYAVVIGESNTNSGVNSTILGRSNSINGSERVTVIGSDNSVGSSSNFTSVIGKSNVLANNSGSIYILGSNNGTTSNKTGGWIFGNGGKSYENNQFIFANQLSTQGDCQKIIYIARNQSTSATAVKLFVDTTSYPSILTGKSWCAMIYVVARTIAGSGVGNSAIFVRKVGLKNIGGTVSLIGSVETIGTDQKDSGTTSWTVSPYADNLGLFIDCTGEASKTINWSARIEIIEIG